MYYSQDNQDLFLDTNVFKGYKFGIFVDVGAYDGKKYSNTLFFEESRKWNGINIEANKTIYDLLIINRPNCININYAIHDQEGTYDFILNTGYTEMISGLKSEYDARHFDRLNKELEIAGGTTNILKVETKRLDTLFEENNIKYINYLSIDVEGAELSVIKSINFDKVFIDVIGFENNYKDISKNIIEYLKEKKYILIPTNNDYAVDIFMINVDSKFFRNVF